MLQAGRPWFASRQGKDLSLASRALKPTLSHACSPMKWVSRGGGGGQNYSDSKQKLYEIMKMQRSAILGKAKPDTENIRGLNLAEVKRLDCCCSIHFGMICCTEPVLTEV
jgi:hypothetical protein